MIRIRRAVRAVPVFAEARLSDPVAFAAQAAPTAPPHDQIIREFADPYLELVRMLREAAEIEHALMVQYLYAAFSVKPRYAAIVGPAFPHAHGLLGIAIQEMQHLNIVSTALSALGAAPKLTTQDFPYEPDIFPFPFNLEPLSRQSIATYVFAEAPAHALMPRPGAPDPFVTAVLQALGTVRPNHLGSVYGAIIDLFQELVATPPFTLPDLSGHVNSLRFVKGQGETAHFDFFKSLFLASHPGFGGNDHAWILPPDDPAYPSLPLPTNPRALGGSPGQIADPTLLSLAVLGNLHYWTILLLLDLTYRYARPDYMACAKNHMTGPLFELGQLLASREMGLPFDAPSLGHAPSLNEGASVRLLTRVLREADARTTMLRDILPPTYAFMTINETLDTLTMMGGT